MLRGKQFEGGWEVCGTSTNFMGQPEAPYGHGHHGLGQVCGTSTKFRAIPPITNGWQFTHKGEDRSVNRTTSGDLAGAPTPQPVILRSSQIYRGRASTSTWKGCEQLIKRKMHKSDGD